MAGSREAVLRTVWQQVDDALKTQAVAFWRQHQAIEDEDAARARAGQLVTVARDRAGELVAVSTAEARRIPRFVENLYYFRMFVAPAWRGGRLALRMLLDGRRALETHHQDLAAPEAIGILLDLQNPVFLKKARYAVWPRSGFIYAGMNPQGVEQRVYYFPGARLSPRG